MYKDKLIQEIARHVESLFHSHLNPALVYHNLDHTRQVVLHVGEILGHYTVSIHSSFVILATAWFHDTGYLFGNAKGHEKVSVGVMKEFLTSKNADKEIINDISVCIMATKMPVSPSSFKEQVICDADNYHLGTRDFFRLNELVWREMELRLDRTIDNKLEQSLSFLEKHQFFTEYCKQVLSAGKDRNIAELKMLL